MTSLEICILEARRVHSFGCLFQLRFKWLFRVTECWQACILCHGLEDQQKKERDTHPQQQLLRNRKSVWACCSPAAPSTIFTHKWVQHPPKPTAFCFAASMALLRNNHAHTHTYTHKHSHTCMWGWPSLPSSWYPHPSPILWWRCLHSCSYSQDTL